MKPIGYCYVNDAMQLEREFEASDYEVCLNDPTCPYGARIQGKPYKDADECSKDLYKDLEEMWGQPYERWSSDYIGPSRYWAAFIGLPDAVIGESIRRCRTFGGHMIWPLHTEGTIRGLTRTINTARGGSSGYYDRIDLSLNDIRLFFIREEKGPGFRGRSRLMSVLYQPDEKAFLSSYGKGLAGFKNFIDYWKLTPFVHGEDYQVISLATSHLPKGEVVVICEEETVFPGDDYGWMKARGTLTDEVKECLQKGYKNYMDNNIYAIEQRNKQIAENMVK